MRSDDRIMSPMKLHMSNRLEILAEELARILTEPLDSPFTPEIVVVQSKGMDRWVSMQLARHHGISANCRFPFPNAFVHELFRKMHEEVPEVSLYEPPYLTWKIMEVLPGLLREPPFENLKLYLGEGPRDLRHLQLSSSIAEIFDQYVLYRPHWLARWEAGEEDHWQAVLWRKLQDGVKEKHRAAMAGDFFRKLRQCGSETCELPQRISVFGISYLPPFHLQMLDQVAAFTRVHLFLLNPCAQYWGDIASRRDLRRLERSSPQAVLVPREIHLETGNSLLASLGMMGRDFFDLLFEFHCQETEHYHDPGSHSLLRSIQRDILHLWERGGGNGEREGKAPSRRDRSIEVLSCHSPMRQVEALHDHLLELFEKDGELRPGDILVMCPDIEAYAPFVQAVFSSPESSRRKIPYSISDRSMRGESRVLDFFLSLLDLPLGRFSAPQVLDILQFKPVQARFGMQEGDMDTISRWVEKTRIRWGWDEADRRRWCGGEGAQNSWRAGLDRLLLGYAMPGKGLHLFHGILPHDELEGSETILLGKFLDFLETLRALLPALGEQRTLGQWAQSLRNFVDDFFLPDQESIGEVQVLRGLLEHLRELERVSGFEDAVDISTLRWHFKRHLERKTFGYGFMTGGVTFCSMLPMRSIPFKVICLMGMDVDAYPRQTKNAEFDLMVKSPRKGDRSPRNDDRYLFLETILSAREKLLITYTGQSVQDNSPIPPSVLVSELLDYVAFALECEPGHLITRHRLQSFSPEYFKGGDALFSYSQSSCDAARGLLSKKDTRPPFGSSLLPEPSSDWSAVSLSDLRSFFANPCRFFLQRRLGLFLDDHSATLEDTEPFQLEGLEKYQLEQILLEKRMENVSWEWLRPSMKASGVLPHGRVGECVLENCVQGVEHFLKGAKPYMEGGELEPLEADLSLDGFQLRGRLARIYSAGVLRQRPAAIKAKDLLGLWIDHLLLNLLRPADYPDRSVVVGLQGGTEQVVRMSPPKDARSLLKELLKIYWEGLSRPLHFFPECAREYALKTAGGSERPKALHAAAQKWSNEWRLTGESNDPYVRMCFEGSDPLMDPEFERLALQVFEPLLQCVH